MKNIENGKPIVPSALVTPRAQWKQVGSITVTQATLAVNARDYSTVTALAATKHAIWDVPAEVSGCFMRFQTSTDADAHVVEVWVAAWPTYADGTTEDQFMLGCILTLTGGTQVGPNANVFCDTIAKTAATGVLSEGSVIDSGANERVALYRCDLQGYKKIVFIATNLAGGKTIIPDVRWY